MARCLIVEGDGNDTPALKALMSPYGMECDAVSSAQDALEKCKSQMPDVIFVSEPLPSMDAISFIRRIRRTRTRCQPAVLVWCGENADAARLSQAIWEGASECLIKPFDAEILDLKLRQSGVV